MHMFVIETVTHMCIMYDNSVSGADLGGGSGGCNPPNDFEQPLPLIYKAYYSLAQ